MVLFVMDLVLIATLQMTKIPFHNHVPKAHIALAEVLTAPVLLEHTVILNMEDMKMIVLHVRLVSHAQVILLIKSQHKNVTQDFTV